MHRSRRLVVAEDVLQLDCARTVHMTGFILVELENSRDSQTKVPAQQVVVAMSGGVDSSVAAALLKKQGYQVIGVTLKLQECEKAQASRSCCGIDGIARARKVAGQLGISHYVLDCVQQFEQQVLRPAWDEYEQGRTPSPCLLCNERIKFGTLLRWSRQLGASYLATGHYARIETRNNGLTSNKLVLLRGADVRKDQSYFLAGLRPEQLSSILFPLGGFEKTEVREIGRSLGIATADTQDSQDACLVSQGESFAEMLRKRFAGNARAGVITNESGQLLGKHTGIHQFTVGQRKGIGIASTKRYWVKAVHGEQCQVMVTDTAENLMCDCLVARDMSWMVDQASIINCQVQIRYRHQAAAATVSVNEHGASMVVFQKPVRAITPGQAAVFYDGEQVLGRGWISVDY